MDSPILEAKVVGALNRRPSEDFNALDLVCDDGKSPLRMALLAAGFKEGQRVRIVPVEVAEAEDDEDVFLS